MQDAVVVPFQVREGELGGGSRGSEEPFAGVLQQRVEVTAPMWLALLWFSDSGVLGKSRGPFGHGFRLSR